MKVYGRVNRHKGDFVDVVDFKGMTIWRYCEGLSWGEWNCYQENLQVDDTHLEGIKCHLFEFGTHQHICSIS